MSREIAALEEELEREHEKLKGDLNRKRVQRLWREEGLCVPRRRRKSLPPGSPGHGPELTANAQRDWCRLGASGASYISCTAGQGPEFEALSDLGVELALAEEPEPLGRGGGLRFAARQRRDTADVYALNGDELLDVDLAAMLELHHSTSAAATVAVAPRWCPPSVWWIWATRIASRASGRHPLSPSG